MTIGTSTAGNVKVGLTTAKDASNSKASKRAFGLSRRVAFYTDMAAFITAKLPPYQALLDMLVVARKRRSTRGLAAVYQSVIDAMERKQSISVALSKFVPGSEAVMLVGAETAGPDVLHKAFGELGRLLKRQQLARKKLVGALVAGGINFLITIGLVIFVVVLVVPKLSASVTPDMLPHMIFAPGFFTFSQWVTTFGAFIIAAIVGIAFWITWSLSRWTRNWRYWSRRWFDRHLMPWTLYVRTQATFFLSSTAAMMRAGIPLKKIVTDMIPFATPWMRKHLRVMLKTLTAGQSPTAALGSGLLPEDTGDRLQVYQRLPDFTDVMTQLADDNFTRYEDAISALSVTMVSISKVILACFIVALLLAIFDYTTAIQTVVQAARATAGGG